jgi:hypothetical protein
MADNINISSEQNQVTAGEVSSFPTPAVSQPSETLGMLERVEKATAILQETEKRIDNKKREIETILSRQMLGGRAEAGQINKTPEQLEKDEVERQIKARLAF